MRRFPYLDMTSINTFRIILNYGFESIRNCAARQKLLLHTSDLFDLTDVTQSDKPLPSA